MKHDIILPPQQLRPYVRFFWTIDFSGISDNNDSTFKVFARRFPRMVFQHNNGNSAIYNGSNKLPISYISGLNTQPYVCGIQPNISVTGVSLYPSAIKFLLGVDSCELVNELPDLVNFVPRELTDRVLDASTQNEKIKIICSYLSKLATCALAKNVPDFGWQLVNSSREYLQLKDLQEVFNVSDRQLIRKFYATVGMSPKQFLRIARFEKSIELIHHSKSSLADIAYGLKYSDQSHFIREFKEFSHFTPLEYVKQHKLYHENSAIMIR